MAQPQTLWTMSMVHQLWPELTIGPLPLPFKHTALQSRITSYVKYVYSNVLCRGTFVM